MSKFKSWSKLFVLVLLVFAFAGCGGGGGGNTSTTPTSDTLTWDTDPNPNNSTPTTPTTPTEPVTPAPTEPDTPTPVTPEPTTPEPQPTNPTPVQPEPSTPEPNTGDTYTDTYDISSVADGTWEGISGNGTATGVDGQYTLDMQSINATVWGTKITGNTGETYITQRSYWNCYGQNGLFIVRLLLRGDALKGILVHAGVNTWRCENTENNEDILTITLISNTTAIVKQECPVEVGGYSYHCSLTYTLQKRNSTTPTPQPDTQTPDTHNYTDTYDIASVLNGSWYGVSGSGTATGKSGQINLLMSSMSISVVNTQINGDNGTSYVTYRQYWNYKFQNYNFQALLYLDAEQVSIKHTGSNTWSLENTDGFATLMLTSETTAIVTQQGTVDTQDGKYSYSVRYTIKKLY